MVNRKLSEYQPNTLCRVLGIKPGELSAKLMEMGLYKGQTLRVLFKAPLGCPIAVEVGGYILSLRKDEAALIEVTPLELHEIIRPEIIQPETLVA